jgi:dihydrofolate synthase/folylpolyglutamate synthase
MKKSLEEWLTWQETLHLSEIDLGLDRIHKVAKNLDLLSPSFPVLTVAGTNGKGSCVALLDTILKAQGYKTGNYTSPHLIHYNERIKLGGINVSDVKIIKAFEAINKARGNISLTYFEFGTLAAMLIFTQENIDVAILEVGLGGRLDAANLWDASLALITSIAIDHVDWLGDNRDIIAVEKSGIMRKDMPVISGEPNPPKTIASEAQRVGANLYQINQDFSYSDNQQNWTWKGWKTQYLLPYPSLQGEFQLNNAATVIAGITAIKPLLPVSADSIKQGLLQATAPGRLQVIFQSPQWLIDVAHNPHAAKALAAHLKKEPVRGKTIALFSMLKDKDINEVLSIMDKYIDEWHIFGLKGSRGLSINELKQVFAHQRISGDIFSYKNLSSACKALKNIANIEDRVVAFGSFLVVSDVIEKCN